MKGDVERRPLFDFGTQCDADEIPGLYGDIAYETIADGVWLLTGFFG